jgi:hypothetical protein
MHDHLIDKSLKTKTNPQENVYVDLVSLNIEAMNNK